MTEAARPPGAWGRFALVHALQLLPVGILLVGTGASAPWLAGILGSAICAAGTDSGWRWRNRLLVLEAAAWLLVPMLIGLAPPAR